MIMDTNKNDQVLIPASEKKSGKERKAEKSLFEINPEISFSVTEAYKALRTNINFAIPGEGCKSFLITSAVLSEGKTTTSSSLALTIAQTSARVIIVDCDMRRPKVHSKFKMVNKTGLSNILSGMCKPEEAIQSVETVPTLSIISAGTLPPNPAELLSGVAMEELVAFLKTKYDYVILDTPPVDIVADALPLTQLVDGVVLVVRYHQSIHPELAAAIERLEFAGAKILGFVLNSVEETTTYYRGRYKRSYKRYGYNYGYNYGYGYSSEKRAKREKESPAETPIQEPQVNVEEK